MWSGGHGGGVAKDCRPPPTTRKSGVRIKILSSSQSYFVHIKSGLLRRRLVRHYSHPLTENSHVQHSLSSHITHNRTVIILPPSSLFPRNYRAANSCHQKPPNNHPLGPCHRSSRLCVKSTTTCPPRLPSQLLAAHSSPLPFPGTLLHHRHGQNLFLIPPQSERNSTFILKDSLRRNQSELLHA